MSPNAGLIRSFPQTSEKRRERRHAFNLISAFRRSPEHFCLGQVEPRLQLLPLRCSRRSRRKGSTRAPSRMAVEDIPLKRAVRARMPSHVEKHPPAPRHAIRPLPASPRPSRRPALPKLRLSLFHGRHAVRACHGTGDGHRPKPVQLIRTAAGLVNPADCPFAAVDGVVRSVLVGTGAKARRAKGGISRSS